jgi:hypothetical protein
MNNKHRWLDNNLSCREFFHKDGKTKCKVYSFFNIEKVLEWREFYLHNNDGHITHRRSFLYDKDGKIKQMAYCKFHPDGKALHKESYICCKNK